MQDSNLSIFSAKELQSGPQRKTLEFINYKSDIQLGICAFFPLRAEYHRLPHRFFSIRHDLPKKKQKDGLLVSNKKVFGSLCSIVGALPDVWSKVNCLRNESGTEVWACVGMQHSFGEPVLTWKGSHWGSVNHHGSRDPEVDESWKGEKRSGQLDREDDEDEDEDGDDEDDGAWGGWRMMSMRRMRSMGMRMRMTRVMKMMSMRRIQQRPPPKKIDLIT